ncbi:hypothetical protein MLP_37920 [Microlunatus phosphovorus NM-1]|uniref:Resolvase/invertase-type recombinase catalytic domain-containing protein n=1 Tax=Microlunatus phosphovorus (strain ATCC 700054 / DSM 10555 / JCM 9379 / NBRC 101784 / NCIMB 13414 / VKM Ac-1990 / NM-1) TaxID=1032480 RepID=F5XPX5_MICPN|nr:hypothetical protein MLP_37920 [Microlunatus phosphovorus NM-1]
MTIVNADQIGATIVAEFVGAGESARKADRPELMRMIRYVTEHQVNYCIVHKVDRLARNRADDVTIHLALRDAGVMLVSASENIDRRLRGRHGRKSDCTRQAMLIEDVERLIEGLYETIQVGGETPTGPGRDAARGVRPAHGIGDQGTGSTDDRPRPAGRRAGQAAASPLRRAGRDQQPDRRPPRRIRRGPRQPGRLARPARTRRRHLSRLRRRQPAAVQPGVLHRYLD